MRSNIGSDTAARMHTSPSTSTVSSGAAVSRQALIKLSFIARMSRHGRSQ